MTARVLVIAGSDSGGGAGIQGDIKTVTMLGGYAATAITALTAQNTLGVLAIHAVPASFIVQQIEVVLSDIGADAIKTGMLQSGAVVRCIAGALEAWPAIPLIVDPVMAAKGGAALLQSEAVEGLLSLLIPRAALVTPNIPEAELLLDSMGYAMKLHTQEDMEKAALRLLETGCQAVLMKGGHLEGEKVTDILVARNSASCIRYSSARLATPHTHGTGCTLASAIATGIAQRMTLEEAVRRAHHYVHEAIRAAPGLGQGHGPLGHNWNLGSASRI